MNVTASTPPDVVAAVTAWLEARDQGARGMQAVLCVVVTRAANPRWWGSDVRTVCLHPWQFSGWFQERAALAALTEADPQYVEALALAREAIAGRLADITNGADSYYAAGTPEPAWAEGKQPCAVIGAHRFYRVELGHEVPARPLPSPAPAWSAPWMRHTRPQTADPTDALNAAELQRVQAADLGGQSVEDVSAVS